MRTKRTYNLSTDVVATVKRLVETEHAAPTQDALVVTAILQYARGLVNPPPALRWPSSSISKRVRRVAGRVTDADVLGSVRLYVARHVGLDIPPMQDGASGDEVFGRPR